MITVNIHVYGIVQGVGFRPFTAVAAERFGIKGTVANKGSYVEIIAQGSREAIDAFADEIRHRPPERAVILGLDELDTAGEFPVFDGFEIIESEKEYGDIFVSPDIATCDKCRSELFDKNNRRYLHPFINCTQCGPRLTILDAMPYDRERTSMKEFPMCEKCASEYYSPETRRFDAQPVCCNDCGPEVYILGREQVRDREALSEVRRIIMDGGIAAVKGIGGFHLCCDAGNTEAVERLRKLKRRPMKPFAVMMRDMQTVRRECIVEEGQEEYLTGWQKPIMLLEKRPDQTISSRIAPDNLTVGVMLPYAPVQMLLFDLPDGREMTDCLVMTSGNARGAPICRDDESAVSEIGGFCDIILSHNRKILIRADDSVTDWLYGKPYMIRRSRGFAPLPVMGRGDKSRQVIAVGGELKNSFCIARGGMLYPSPYIGDMADLRTLKALEESSERMCEMLEAVPQAVAADSHPMYNTVTFAQEYAEKHSIPLVKVQHHYAHILSCMAENDCFGRVIGLSLDGTGYGDDGTIWGGEILLCDRKGYERAGFIEPFMQVGGDISAKEGWRIAASLLRQSIGGDAEKLCEELGICSGGEYRLIRTMAEKGLNSVTSTSCGRLFDAVSAILGIRRASTFEGEASTALMYHAQLFEKKGGEGERCFGGELVRNLDGKAVLCTGELAAYIARQRREDMSDEGRDRLAYEFHSVLADMLTASAVMVREQSGTDICALSGGVFQNKLLVRMTNERLTQRGFRVLLHSLIPPNDGGIALGQAAYAMQDR
ncbi:MAG: carbamoyltransferase HypF [Ruminococcus sp.]|nr:carbamoyltransferase HypF [Ruminococcus sp.]